MLTKKATLVIQPNGDVDWRGIEQPNGQLVAMHDDIIVVKVPGRNYWRGVGLTPGYAGAEYQVFRIVGKYKNTKNIYKAEPIIDVPLRVAAEEPRAQYKRFADKQWPEYDPESEKRSGSNVEVH